MSEIRKSMQNKFGEIIGEASMCWTETPSSVFDSTRAVDLVQKCLDVVHQEIGMGVTRYSEIMSDNAKLKRANEIMKTALDFYAIGWVKKHARINDFGLAEELNKNAAVSDDAGKRARQALSEIEGDFDE